MGKKFIPQSFQSIQGLLTYRHPNGRDHYLGDLWHAKGHGTFDPDLGRVNVTEEEAEAHNKALDKAKLEGLDQNCQIGQGGSFYFHDGSKSALGRDMGHRHQVKTFNGTVVSGDVEKSGISITFRRNGKTFRGRLSKQQDLFNFRRVA